MARKKPTQEITVFNPTGATDQDEVKNDFAHLHPRQQVALAAFVDYLGNVTAACQAAKISRNTWYEWKKIDEAFQKALADVDAFFADQLEAACHNFAFQGDSTLLIFMLKAKRREKYDDAFARQERAFEKGQQPLGTVATPIHIELVRGKGPEDEEG